LILVEVFKYAARRTLNLANGDFLAAHFICDIDTHQKNRRTFESGQFEVSSGRSGPAGFSLRS
jgi:hypothetical protein